MAAVPIGGSGQPARSRQRKGRIAALATLIVLLLAGLVGGGAWWLGSGRYVAVPQVRGKPVAEARDIVLKADLVPKVSRAYHNTVDKGIVISASPKQGSELPAGGEVELLVSRGRPKVPQIEPGITVEKAKSLLREVKLDPTVDSSARQYHKSVPKDRVIGVNPKPGTPLAMDTQVTIIVSKGPRPVPVPDVVGMSRKQAFETLRQAGFEPYVAAQKFSDDVARNHVISTSPSVGTEVKLRGTPKVGVVLSNAVTVPNLSGMHTKQAEKKLAELGLKLEVKSVFNRNNPRILGQYPLPGSEVKPGTTITVTAF